MHVLSIIYTMSRDSGQTAYTGLSERKLHQCHWSYNRINREPRHSLLLPSCTIKSVTIVPFLMTASGMMLQVLR